MILDFIAMTAVAASDSIVSVSKSMNVSETIQALSGMTLADVVHATTDLAVSVVGKIIQLALIWYIGRWLSRRLVKLVKVVMERREVAPSVRTFVASLLDVVSLIIILIMIISILGIDTSSFIALFASAGVAIGMANTISNMEAFNGNTGNIIVTVVLCATLVYELVGPLLTKWSLQKAGEIPAIEEISR